MLRSTLIGSLAPLFLGLLGTQASAQTAPQWDRGISNVRKVHPPGTAPGRYEILVEHVTVLDPSAPVGLDLSRDIVVAVDGVPMFFLHDPQSNPSVTSACLSTCTQTGCTTLVKNSISISLDCGYVFPSGPCGCGIRLEEVFLGGSYVPSNVITATLVPSPGAVGEIETSNDSFSIVIGENEPSTPFCAGDGTLPTPCPCGNNGASGRGCANSANPSGALLGATGFTEVDPLSGTDSVVLHGSGMPATSTAIYLKGDAAQAAITFGDGLICTGGSLIRLRAKANVAGASQFPEPGDPSVSVRGATPPGSGLVGRYQVYYRNAAAAFCPPATFNVSSGVEILW